MIFTTEITLKGGIKMANNDAQWKQEIQKVNGEMDSFLMIGQSNMAGRGIIGAVPPIDPRDCMFMLRNGRWQPMTEPINPDRKIFVSEDTDFRSGICLTASFAESYANTCQRRVGLIPCADGGTALREWQPGEILFDHAVMQAKLAQRTSRICGILWHQGESDSHTMEEVEAYEGKFFNMLDAMMAELGLPEDTPVILGELTEKLIHRWPYTPECNRVLNRIAASRSNIGIAHAKDLDIGPDGIHFTAQSYRVFGRRYFEAYQAVVNRNR